MLSNRGAAVLHHCSKLVQRAWPWTCVLCGALSRRGDAGLAQPLRFCAGCECSLPRLPAARCARCAMPLTSGAICGECMKAAPAYDDVLAPFAYDFPVDALIQRYKYAADLALAPVLGRSLAGAIAAPADALIPMPLSPARLRERGFNQAQEISRYVGRALRVPVLAQATRKVNETAPQAALPWGERARNVRGAFVCDVNLAGRSVAIVDDVMTTGATANELSRVLKRAGAARVSVWVIARTLRNRA